MPHDSGNEQRELGLLALIATEQQQPLSLEMDPGAQENGASGVFAVENDPRMENDQSLEFRRKLVSRSRRKGRMT